MVLGGADLAQLLLALGLLVVVAHVVGHLFVVLRQPRVIGEIVGGLLLGPTVLGALEPGWHDALLPDTGPTAAVLGWSYQLGLILLMFCSGAELRASLRPGEGRLVGIVTVLGVTVPFAAGLAVFWTVDPSGLEGTAGNRTALTLVFGLAIAVTSIPVISRIMVDLDIIHTSFARVVLGIAVLEDVVVYVVLALALGLVETPGQQTFGIPALLSLRSGSSAELTFHVVATLTFLTVMLLVAPRLFARLRGARWNVLATSSPIAFHIVFLFTVTLAALALGITAIFGAFLAGIAASSQDDPGARQVRESVKGFAFAYFVPVYFAIVGVQLDLVHAFDPLFFGWFLVFACGVKTASAYLGARLAGEPATGARNLALATNARGGPGIVLASVAWGAGIVSESFYTSLVLLAIVTSMVTGSWLGHVVSSGAELRAEPPPPIDVHPAAPFVGVPHDH